MSLKWVCTGPLWLSPAELHCCITSVGHWLKQASSIVLHYKSESFQLKCDLRLKNQVWIIVFVIVTAQCWWVLVSSCEQQFTCRASPSPPPAAALNGSLQSDSTVQWQTGSEMGARYWTSTWSIRGWLIARRPHWRRGAHAEECAGENTQQAWRIFHQTYNMWIKQRLIHTTLMLL